MENKHIREQYIVSKPYVIASFLNALKEANKRINDKQLREMLPNLRGGSYQNAKKDAKNLLLVNNGGGTIEINNEGIKFIQESKNPEFLKENALKLELFKQMYNKNIRGRHEAEIFLNQRLTEDYSPSSLKLISYVIALRYLEYVFNDKKKLKRKEQKISLINFTEPIKYEPNTKLLLEIIELRKKYNHDEITNALNKLQGIK